MNSKLLADLFGEFSEKHFILIKPGGNWGDDLIYMGAESLAKRYNLDFDSYTFNDLGSLELHPDDVVYIHGGGGFNNYSSKNSYKLLSTILSRHKGTVIQGPCTVSQDEDAIADFKNTFANINSSNFIFFAREEVTFERMKKLLPENTPLYLDHDTALHLTREEFLLAANVSDTSYDLVAMRQDREVATSQSNLNVAGVELDPAYFALNFKHWLRLHAKARTIVTNRTHSSIAGAILRTPTTLFSGAYHKNHSIWKYSLQSKNVKWLDIDNIENNVSYVSIWEKIYRMLPGRMKKSWKIKRFIKWLQGVPLQ